MEPETLESPAFRIARRMMMDMGPFSTNPKVDETYVTLRLMGLTSDQAWQAIWEEMRRRGIDITFKHSS